MQSENIVLEKSYTFALSIVRVCKELAKNNKEVTLSKQLLRSGTSIGANITEAQGAHSKKEFASKMAIAQKEAKESLYWIRLLQDSGILKKEEFSGLENDCVILNKLLSKIVQSSKEI